MCGNVGVAGNLRSVHEDVFRRLLIYDVLRGPDSTGVAAVKTNGDVAILKAACNPLELMEYSKFSSTVNGFSSSALIGHNRLATKGKINNLNAHPYQFGNITGCHNGTLDTDAWHSLEDALGEKYPVDSMALIAGIEKLGIDETIKMVYGAWALVWHDATDNTLNFLKNDERPLWLAASKDHDVIFWASEYQILIPAIGLAKEDIQLWTDDGGYAYFPLEDDTLYSFDLKELEDGLLENVFKCGQVRKVEGGERPVKIVPPFQKTLGKGGASGGGKKDDFQVVFLEATEEDPIGGVLTKEEFNHITKYGCSWCQADIEYGDEGIVLIPSEEVALCGKCSRAHEGTTFLLGKEELNLIGIQVN